MNPALATFAIGLLCGLIVGANEGFRWAMRQVKKELDRDDRDK